MKRSFSARLFRTTAMACVLGLLALGSTQAPAGNPNPGVLPPGSNAFGKSYGDWSAIWWQWASGIPAAVNPILDTTGEFADQEQSGPVYFLAGTFGGPAERTITVPHGKALFFPLVNSAWWAPDDLPFAEFVAEYLGLDPDTMTDEELIRLMAVFSLAETTELTCTLDGRNLRNLKDYYVESKPFRFFDTDLADDLGIPISQPNLAVSAGYWLMLAPLSAGKHELRFTAKVDNPIFGEFALDVTYHITVGKP